MLVAVTCLWLSFRNARFSEVWRIVGEIGPIAPIILVPYFVAVTVDTTGWRRIFLEMGHRLRLRRLLGVRFATEAVLMSAPGGSVLSDTIKPFVLKATDRVPISATLTSVALRKWSIMAAEVVYLSIGCVIGFSLYRAASEPVLGQATGFEWIVVAATALLALGVVASFAMLSGGTLTERVYTKLMRVLPAFLSDRLRSTHDGARALDAYMRRVFTERRRGLAVSVALYVGHWFIEATETWLIANLLGVPLDFTHAVAIESACSFLRAIAFFVPAGLGVQDLGYATLFAVAGVPAPVEFSLAFTLVKRSKELVWVVIGYLVLLSLPIKRRPVMEAAAAPGESALAADARGA
ncbi:lysylphosphatidylglycerol synthase domain-containing protein [Haliangium ochraceum]|uniref:lysylphosphatidylglycerol synthase domain-containing protein n=1 Tax=Haliangium ochraceum TaxID=80816 RepID=UPI00019B99D8|nr:lysylphosphatidylglycerol synthase domain-containing protein [Haliangium ochraceum]